MTIVHREDHVFKGGVQIQGANSSDILNVGSLIANQLSVGNVASINQLGNFNGFAGFRGVATLDAGSATIEVTSVLNLISGTSNIYLQAQAGIASGETASFVPVSLTNNAGFYIENADQAVFAGDVTIGWFVVN